MKYPTLVKVHYCMDYVEKQEMVAVYADNYADAAKMVEDYYDDTLISMEIAQYAEGLMTFPIEHEPMLKKIFSEYV